VEIARQAADAMAFAHVLGMIHRDLKPGNVMIDRQGTVKVMDLGLAKCEEPGEGSSIMLTREGVPIGTVDYLAPEQAGDATRVTASADIYSLGCTLYHLLCGHPPFPKGSLVERLIAHQKDAPAPVAALRPDVPEALAALIDSMLAKQPAERPASMAKFLEAMSPWLLPEGEGRELLRRLVEEHGAAAGSETVGNCAEAGICDADTVCPGAAAAPQPASATDLVPVTIIGCEAPWRDRLRSRQSRRGIRRVFKDLLRGASRLGTPPRRH
jgi:serine/threonine protein kinase